MHVVNTHIDTI